MQDYKESLSGTRERLFVLERSKENDQEYVAELVKDKLTLSTALMDVEKELANYQSLAAERELKMNQYLIDKQNMEAMM